MADEPFFLEPFIRNVPFSSLFIPATRVIETFSSITGASTVNIDIPVGYRLRIMYIAISGVTGAGAATVRFVGNSYAVDLYRFPAGGTTYSVDVSTEITSSLNDGSDTSPQVLRFDGGAVGSPMALTVTYELIK